jgi:hypothetical protein
MLGTRGGVLGDLIKAQLHLDIVANPKLSCDQIINLPDREYQAQASKAIRNRHLYLRNTKVKNPQHYWKLYSEAHKLAIGHAPDPSSGEESEEESEESDKEEPATTTMLVSPPRNKSNKNNTMSRSSATKSATKSPAASAFAYNTMFDNLEAAEAAGTSILLLAFHHLAPASF